MNKTKKRWEMTDEERNKQDARTMLIAFFVIVPSIFIGFFITLLITEFIWNNMNQEFIMNIGKIPILMITGFIVFGIGFKIAKKLGIDK